MDSVNMDLCFRVFLVIINIIISHTPTIKKGPSQVCFVLYRVRQHKKL